MTTLYSLPIMQQPPILVVKENFDDRHTFMAQPWLTKLIEDEISKTGEHKSELVRRALEAYFNPKPSLSDHSNFRAPFLNSVPCGPWAEAVETGTDYVISKDVADEMFAEKGDVFVRADGLSMEGAGILDDFVVLVRPYNNKVPRRGEIVLIQVFTQDDSCLGTIKRFNGLDKDGKPKLLDGNDDDYDLPDDYTGHQIIGRAVGVVGRL